VAALKKGSEASGRNQRSSIVSSQSEDVDDVEPAAVKMNDAGPSAASLSKLSYISQTMSVDQRKQGNEAAVTSLSSLLQTDRDAPSTGAVTSVRKKYFFVTYFGSVSLFLQLWSSQDQIEQSIGSIDHYHY
jgi:hypothetical protein